MRYDQRYFASHHRSSSASLPGSKNLEVSRIPESPLSLEELVLRKLDETFQQKTEEQNQVANNENVGQGGTRYRIPLLPKFHIDLPTTKNQCWETSGIYENRIVWNFSAKNFHLHLLWHLLYKGVTVEIWYCLYQVFEKMVRSRYPDNELQIWCGLLHMSSNTGSPRLRSFKSRTKGIWKTIQEYNVIENLRETTDKDEDLLHYIHRVLDLPNIGMEISNFGLRTTERYILKPPVALQRIGVGYKDHGSLGSGTSVPEPPDAFIPEALISKVPFLLREWFASFK